MDSVDTLGRQYRGFVRKHATYKGKKLGMVFDSPTNRRKALQMFMRYHAELRRKVTVIY